MLAELDTLFLKPQINADERRWVKDVKVNDGFPCRLVCYKNLHSHARAFPDVWYDEGKLDKYF